MGGNRAKGEAEDKRYRKEGRRRSYSADERRLEGKKRKR